MTILEKVVEENKELQAKMARLASFLRTENFEGLPLRAQELLLKQLDIMRQYSECLNERILILKQEEVTSYATS